MPRLLQASCGVECLFLGLRELSELLRNMTQDEPELSNSLEFTSIKL